MNQNLIKSRQKMLSCTQYQIIRICFLVIILKSEIFMGDGSKMLKSRRFHFLLSVSWGTQHATKAPLKSMRRLKKTLQLQSFLIHCKASKHYQSYSVQNLCTNRVFRHSSWVSLLCRLSVKILFSFRQVGTRIFCTNIELIKINISIVRWAPSMSLYKDFWYYLSSEIWTGRSHQSMQTIEFILKKISFSFVKVLFLGT